MIAGILLQLNVKMNFCIVFWLKCSLLSYLEKKNKAYRKLCEIHHGTSIAYFSIMLDNMLTFSNNKFCCSIKRKNQKLILG